MGCTKGQFSSCGDIFKISFCLKNPTKRSKKNSGCYLIEKNAKPSSPDLPRRRRLAEEEERDIQRPRSTRTQTRRYLRAFARSNAPTARVWTFLSSFPPSYDSTRDCARHILSLRFPDTGQKRKQRESNPIRERAQKKVKRIRNPTTYRLRDSLRGRFSAHGRDRDASVRDLGDRGHYYFMGGGTFAR